MVGLVVGLGEVGQALYEILKNSHPTKGYDLARGVDSRPFFDIDIIHICIPYTEKFLHIVQEYIDLAKPKYCVVHSSVPVGTCEKLTGTVVFHSPVRGTHPDMKRGLMTFVKYIASDRATHEQFKEVEAQFTETGMRTKRISSLRTSELMKLLELARYGVYLAFAKEQEAICKQFGVDYTEAFLEFEGTSNQGLREEGKAHMQQPLLTPFNNYIGGHCTLENMDLLLKHGEHPLLRTAYDIGRATKIWPNCNIMPGAKIGKGCSVGQFTEIDDGVVIGNDVRIGAHCFIPNGVTIEDGCFIAPRVSFSNDKHPPSKKMFWGKIRVCKNAAVGMGAIVLPGVTIGEGAVIGAGAIVTKDVAPGILFYGVAAKPQGKVEEVYNPDEALK